MLSKEKYKYLNEKIIIDKSLIPDYEEIIQYYNEMKDISKNTVKIQENDENLLNIAELYCMYFGIMSLSIASNTENSNSLVGNSKSNDWRKVKMNKLITLTGDSGCGKTHLMRLLMNFHEDDISVIKKYSDRDLRLGEENAIEIKPGCATADVKKMDYVYTRKNDKVYGFSKRDIDMGFQQGKSPIVIVDDEELLIRLCREYENRICPIYMQRDVTDLDFIEELRRARKNRKANYRKNGIKT